LTGLVYSPMLPGDTMKRIRPTFFAACFSLFALVLTAAGCSPPPPAGPNIIILLVDALRPDHMGCYGYHRDTTPRLDELAAESLVFERAYAQAPLTPTSVASILTGNYPGRHNLVGDSQRIVRSWNTRQLLSWQLRRLGWSTGCFSANPLISEAWGFGGGFDHFSHQSWRGAGKLNRDVKDWIDRRVDQGENFFAYIHYMEPHDPYAPRKKRYYRGEQRIADGMINTYHTAIRDGRDPGLDPLLLEEMITLYDSEIHDVDEEIGRLLDWLRKKSLLESTVLAVLADHGEAFMEHGWLKHSSTLYEEMIRIPLIIRPAGGGPAGRVAGTVEAIDVLPTLMAACGVNIPLPIDGRDLLAVKTEQPGPGPERSPWKGPEPLAYSMTWNGWDQKAGRRITLRAVIKDQWKLILTPAHQREELYRLDEDGSELVDLAVQRPEETARLSRLLAHPDLYSGERDLTEEEMVSPEILEQMRSMGYIE